jgi:hypothetical protein
VRLSSDVVPLQNPAGYLAVIPDFFRGKALKAGFDHSTIGQWLGQFPHDQVPI